MSDFTDLINTLADLDRQDSAAAAVETAPVETTPREIAPKPVGVSEPSGPRTQLGQYLQNRRQIRENEYASMTPEEREMRALRGAQIFNAFAAPIAQGMTSVLSKGKVNLGPEYMQASADRQKSLADMFDKLKTEAPQAQYRRDIRDVDLSTPEGQQQALNVAAKSAKPSDLLGYLEKLAALEARKEEADTKRKLNVPLNEAELAELASAPASEKQYAMNDPGGWRKSKMGQYYQGARFEQGLGWQQQQNMYNRINALADDWANDVSNKAYKTVGSIYQQAEQVYSEILKDPRNAGSGDQVLITALNKLVDPSSVVREAEYNRTGADLPVFNRWRADIIRLTRGGRLEPDSRARLMGIMREMNNRMIENVDMSRRALAYRAKAQGIPIESIVGPESTWPKQRTAEEPTTKTISTQQEWQNLPAGAQYIWGPTGERGTKK